MSVYESEKALYKKIFGDSEYLTDFIFRRASKVYSKYIDGSCVALIIATDKVLKVNKCKRKIKFLTGVCTDENVRGKGYFKELLNEVENDAESDKAVGIMLATYIPAIYDKFNYKVIKKQSKIVCRGEDLNYSLAVSNASFMRMNYQEILGKFNMGIERPKKYYDGLDDILKKEGLIVCKLNLDGRNLGYILTDVKGNIEETTVPVFDLLQANCLSGMRIRETYFMFKPISNDFELIGDALVLDVYL